ncbi:MAG TPA: virulence protein RhuM/Fic/DOC family protein, partial [Candidatus Paceibacterota bacterium]|nr:virulence protein RhuM/Fic/DOC family protein [Candidatus Paceibacterota bacterium]
MKKKNDINKGEIVIYLLKSGEVEVKVKLEKETIWLNAHQIAQIFDIDRTVIVKHIHNIYKSGELFEKSTCAKIAQVATDGKIRRMNQYNLDMIISVGYRVNSKRATQFRVWATRVLKEHIVQGYTINQRRLLETQSKFKELQSAIAFLREKSSKKTLEGQEKEILDLLGNYTKTFSILTQYDKGKVKKLKGEKAKFVLEYNHCENVVVILKKDLAERMEASNLFGIETGNKFESIIKNLYQTFDRKELYKTIEEKAAHLLYLVIKGHPFVDGNKRIASFLFVYFLDKNDYLYRKNGGRKINDNALVA